MKASTDPLIDRQIFVISEVTQFGLAAELTFSG